MSYQALYREWRPANFSEIFGQDAIVSTLKRQITTGRIAHAYLFCGTRGTGKTSTSKVFARAINCTANEDGEPCGKCEACLSILNETTMDVSEIDAASNNGVDEIRDLREKVKYPPTNLTRKVYIIDEVHMLSTGAFNALLKTLEEPPAHAVFILATTEPQRLPATILSRCQRFDFRRISADVIVEKLMIVTGGIGRIAEERALYEIARAAEGSMRDAMSLMDVCLAYTDGVVTERLARDILGSSGREFMFEFIDALIENDAARALTLIARAMDEGRDPQVFARECVSHARNALLARFVGQALSSVAELTEEDAARFREQAARASEGKLTRVMELFMKAEPDMKWAAQPRTVLELCAARACHPESEPDASLEERLDKLEKALAAGAMPAKPASAPKQAAPAGAKAAPTPQKSAREPVDAPKEYLDAIANFLAENAPMKAAVAEMRFAAFDGSVVTVEFAKKFIMFKAVLERKAALFDACLTASYGRPVKIAMRVEGDAPAPKAPAVSKDLIAQSYDVFGRENIDLTD